MNTELYIEGYPLDITTELSALLNFAIDDIKDFSARSTTWSRTIVLPGTAKNNRTFGHIFQVGQSNNYNSSDPNVGSNFNAAKSAPCIIFQDQIQAFKGVLRLLQININNGFQGACEYEVSVFGNLVGLNVALSGKLLENLDFSAYDHVYNDSNIVASWDNPGGSGYYYPLMDYGTYSTNKHDWDIHTFRPALYAKEYIDKMFSDAGYRWSSALFDSARFQKIVIPHNQKRLVGRGNTLINAAKDTSNAVGLTANIKFTSPSLTDFTYSVITGEFTYTGVNPVTTDINAHVDGEYLISDDVPGLVIALQKNGADIDSELLPTTTSTTQPFSVNLSATGVVFNTGDTLRINIYTNTGVPLDFDFTQDHSSLRVIGYGVTFVNINLGDTVQVNEAIPKNIRQIDFLVGIVKLFNLYVYEDKFDEHLIYITPFIDFYSKNTANAVDWTHKLNRNKIVKVKPMSELNAKIYKFRFKSDSDYYNELYRKRYNDGYGDRIYDSEFEFTQQVKEFELCFSATPLVGYQGADKVYSTIFKRTGNEPTVTEENVDCNIRILQTKKITGVLSWNIKDGSTVLNTLTRYGYAGHLDDPAVPTDDLNFGAPRELFFTLTAGSLSANQFNVYWSGYMREITDKDSKLVIGFFKLTTKDILNLDFSKYIYVDGIAFRLNAIRDYDVTSPNDCVVELFKVNAASASESSGEGPPEGCYLLWSDEQTLDYDDGEELLYGDCNVNPGDGEQESGEGPPDPPTTFYVNWSFSTTALGTFKIYVNGVLMVSDTSTGSIFSPYNNSGSFEVHGGDVLKTDVTGTVGKTKRIRIANDVDGVLYDNTTILALLTRTENAEASKNYTIDGSINS